MRWFITLLVIAGLACACYAMPAIIPTELSAKLENAPAKIWMSAIAFLLCLNLIAAVYRLVYTPGNRKFLWRLIGTFTGFLAGALLLPPGWALIESMKFEAIEKRWVFDLKAAQPGVPWTSVAIAGIMVAAILVLAVMLKHEPPDKT